MDYKKVEKLTDSQLNDLVNLFHLEWWTKGRERKEVEVMVEHSNVIVGFVDTRNDELAGFARVLTDYVYKALILDVIVSKQFRGQNLGKDLIDAIIHHPNLKGIKHFELYCLPEMMPFYQKWGFTEELGALKFMRRV